VLAGFLLPVKASTTDEAMRLILERRTGDCSVRRFNLSWSRRFFYAEP